MRELTPFWREQVYQAQRELMKDLGAKRAMEITRASKSEVYRWQSETLPDFMSLPHAMMLEAAAGRPLVTRVLAEFAGRELTEEDERQTQLSDLRAQVGALIGQVATLMGREAHAGADGFYSVTELNDLIKLNADVRRMADDLGAVLASAKVAGGMDVVAMAPAAARKGGAA